MKHNYNISLGNVACAFAAVHYFYLQGLHLFEKRTDRHALLITILKLLCINVYGNELFLNVAWIQFQTDHIRIDHLNARANYSCKLY